MLVTLLVVVGFAHLPNNKPIIFDVYQNLLDQFLQVADNITG